MLSYPAPVKRLVVRGYGFDAGTNTSYEQQAAGAHYDSGAGDTDLPGRWICSRLSPDSRSHVAAGLARLRHGAGAVGGQLPDPLPTLADLRQGARPSNSLRQAPALLFERICVHGKPCEGRRSGPVIVSAALRRGLCAKYCRAVRRAITGSAGDGAV